MVWPAIIGAIGTVAGGALSYAGQQDANQANANINAKTRRFNKAQSQKSRKFNRKEARKQRDWSEHMSSTAYQRSMSDMEAAGLNPMLAYQQGGASAGSAQAASSAAAQAGQQHRQENELSQGLGLAEIATQVNTAKMLQAQTRKLDSESEYIGANKNRTDVETELANIRASREGAKQPIWDLGGKAIAEIVGKYGPHALELLDNYMKQTGYNSAQDVKADPPTKFKPTGRKSTNVETAPHKGDGKTDFQRTEDNFQKQLLKNALDKYKHKRAWEHRRKKTYGN